jgi:hypothetical protein
MEGARRRFKLNVLEFDRIQLQLIREVRVSMIVSDAESIQKELGEGSS